MQVLVNDLQTKFKIKKRLIKGVVEDALKDLTGDVIYPLEVSIALVNDEFIQSLNKRYRGVNEATDVLAFPQDQATSQMVHSPQSIVHSRQKTEVRSQKTKSQKVKKSRSREVGSGKWEVGSGKWKTRCQMPDARHERNYGLWTVDCGLNKEVKKSKQIQNSKFNTLPPVLLGDIVVSLDMAECQAKEYHLPLEEEVINLTLHGLLHLLGYKDSTPKQRKAMENKQREILKKSRSREVKESRSQGVKESRSQGVKEVRIRNSKLRIKN